MSTIRNELVYAVRFLLKRPGFSSVAILSLALGIGGTVAVFTLINALLLRELPVYKPERLAEVSLMDDNYQKKNLSFPMYQELSKGQQVFSELFGWFSTTSRVETNGEISSNNILGVTGNFYSGLGTTPLVGRLLVQEDVGGGENEAQPAAVISYDFWRRHFAGDQSVVNKSVRVEGHPFRVVGVTRKWFTGMTVGQPPEVTIPITAVPLLNVGLGELNDRGHLWVNTTARLKDGITIGQASSQVEALWPSVRANTAPLNVTGSVAKRFFSSQMMLESVATGKTSYLRNRFSKPLYVLMGLVFSILVIACLNLANLMTAVSLSRGYEMSVRMTLGASRWRLISQLIMEALVLSFAGGVLGVALSWWGTRILVALVPQGSNTQQIFNLSPDSRVALFTIFTVTIAALLFGIWPAWSTSRHDPAEAMQSQARGFSRPAGVSTRIIVVVQMALSMILLTVGGLLVQSLNKLRTENLGFQKNDVIIANLTATPGVLASQNSTDYHRTMLDQISSLPGVRSASWSLGSVSTRPGWRESVEGALGNAKPIGGLESAVAVVSPHFFETLRISLLGGRDFTWMDDAQHPRVAIVSQTLAHRLNPDASVLGQHVKIGADEKRQDLEIVGVAGDSRLFDLRNPKGLVVYVVAAQEPAYGLWGNLEVLTSSDSFGTAQRIKTVVEHLGYEYVPHIVTLDHAVDEEIFESRILGIFSVFFSSVTLLLATTGLYGLLTYNVNARTREIGIRIALGQQLRDVVLSVVYGGLKTVLAGILVGLPCALFTVRFLSSMLFGISPFEPTIFLATAGILSTIAVVACAIPAFRASRVDPMNALRAE